MFGVRVVTFYLDPARYISSLYLSSQLSYALCTIWIFAASSELYLPERLSSFVRSAVHVVDSLHSHLPSLFDRRVFPTNSIFLCFCLSFPLVHASSRAHYAPRLVSHERRENSCFISLQTIPAFIVFLCQLPLFYQRSPLSLCLCPASTRTFSPFLFHPIHSRSSTFSTFRHLASIIARPFLLHRPSLLLSFFLRLKPPRVSLFNVTLRRIFFLQPPLVLSLHPLLFPLPLSLFLPLAVSHQLTHTLRRRQAPVPCGLVLRARGCCEIIVSLRPSRNQPPRVTPR